MLTNSINREAIQRLNFVNFNNEVWRVRECFNNNFRRFKLTCINVRWLDVRLKKKLSDSLINFSINCEFLLNISNFKWIVKVDKNFVTNFNDLNLLSDLNKLVILKNLYENMKSSFNQVEKKNCFVCWTFCLTRHIMNFNCFIWYESTTSNNLFVTN